MRLLKGLRSSGRHPTGMLARWVVGCMGIHIMGMHLLLNDVPSTHVALGKLLSLGALLFSFVEDWG